jgi:hypothetical protein
VSAIGRCISADGYPDPQGEGGLALLDVVVADGVGAVGGTLQVGLSRSKASSPVWRCS